MKYLIEVPGFGYGKIEIFDDFYKHGDILDGSDGKKYKVWDPWHNRLFRWIFGGYYKRLNIYGQINPS